jgi:hypothetical protein
MDDLVQATKAASSIDTVLGNDTGDDTTCSSRQMQGNALDLIKEASRGLEDAEAFHEACQRVPELVADESNPLWFLR